MKRAARPEVVFQIEPPHSITLRVASFGRDKNFHVLYFRPVILTADLDKFQLTVGTQCIPLKGTIEGECVSYLDRVYTVYDTHALAQDERWTYACYVELTHDDRIKIDPSVHWLPANVPGYERGVSFYPWDINPEEYHIKINCRKIAQCTPQWVRGEVTGTKAYNLIGFWVPTEAQDPGWTLDGDKTFDARSLENMRFGKDSEDMATMIYIQHTGNQVRNVGSYRAPVPYSSSWTASPDGIVNGGQGVLEIKSSKRSLDMEAYFIPQVYLEMICTGTQWTDLVRFCPPRARIYRINRDVVLEARLLALIKRAVANKDHIQRLVHTDKEYIDMRAELKVMARNMTYEQVEANDETLTRFEAYKIYCK